MHKSNFKFILKLLINISLLTYPIWGTASAVVLVHASNNNIISVGIAIVGFLLLLMSIIPITKIKGSREFKVILGLIYTGIMSLAAAYIFMVYAVAFYGK